jgi:hypothetical protein
MVCLKFQSIIFSNPLHIPEWNTTEKDDELKSVLMKLLVCSFHNAPDSFIHSFIYILLIHTWSAQPIGCRYRYIFEKGIQHFCFFGFHNGDQLSSSTQKLHFLRYKRRGIKVFQQDDDNDAPVHIRNFAQSSLNSYYKAS